MDDVDTQSLTLTTTFRLSLRCPLSWKASIVGAISPMLIGSETIGAWRFQPHDAATADDARSASIINRKNGTPQIQIKLTVSRAQRETNQRNDSFWTLHVFTSHFFDFAARSRRNKRAGVASPVHRSVRGGGGSLELMKFSRRDSHRSSHAGRVCGAHIVARRRTQILPYCPGENVLISASLDAAGRYVQSR